MITRGVAGDDGGGPPWAAKFHPPLKIWEGKNIEGKKNVYGRGKIMEMREGRKKDIQASKKKVVENFRHKHTKISKGGKFKIRPGGRHPSYVTDDTGSQTK